MQYDIFGSICMPTVTVGYFCISYTTKIYSDLLLYSTNELCKDHEYGSQQQEFIIQKREILIEDSTWVRIYIRPLQAFVLKCSTMKGMNIAFQNILIFKRLKAKSILSLRPDIDLRLQNNESSRTPMLISFLTFYNVNVILFCMQYNLLHYFSTHIRFSLKISFTTRKSAQKPD